MWKILQRLNKNLIYAIPLFMLAGFLCGGWGDMTIIRKMMRLIEKDGVKNDNNGYIGRLTIS